MSTSALVGIIVVMAMNAPDRAAVLEDIRALTSSPAPLLELVERTLADGYACVHAVEGERLRLRKRLEDTAAALGRSPSPKRVGELADLGEGLARTGDELTELRSALMELAAKARRLRAA